MIIDLRLSIEQDLPELLAFIRAYHELEGIVHADAALAATVRPLLGTSPLGRIWLICREGRSIGYLALCFGYSIEFAGRDAFIDEFFIVPEQRGRGYGRAVLARVKREAAALDIRALHLEVARCNARAQHLYRCAGFVSREHFHLVSAKIGTDECR